MTDCTIEYSAEDTRISQHFRLMFEIRDCGYTTSCWVFIGYCNKQGYGQYSLYGTQKLAHRAIYECIHGDVIADSMVLHKCDNPPCVNPAHLFLGTRMQNTRDMMQKGRQPNLKGESRGCNILTEKDVLQIREWHISPGLTYRELGELFNVARSTIQSIVNRTNWKHI